MSEDIKTKMMLPFKPPITITNETQPGEEEGEVVPVPIHIIVDNAADFPVCDCGGGGGGGSVKHLMLASTFAGAVEGMCDETTEFMVAIIKPDAEDYDFKFIMIPSSVVLETMFIVEPDTSYVMYLQPNSGTMTFNSQINVMASDVDNEVDLTSVCFPYDEYDNRYSIDAVENAVVIEFSIPSSVAGFVEFDFVTQK